VPLPKAPPFPLFERLPEDCDGGAATAPPFLTVRRVLLSRGETGRPFPYDVVERRALDAVVVCATYTENGTRFVYLRSAPRVPLLLRPRPAFVAGPWEGVLWELPAGLVEPGESPAAAAARELHEELGAAMPEAAFVALGGWTVPAPALVAEVHLFFAVEVGKGPFVVPAGDGSPLEEDAVVEAVSLEDALSACRSGQIRDAKTELALRRLAELS
jgi:ADP-ribose pyrophosphatase